MKMMLSGKHVDIGDSLKTHIQEKLEQIITRYVDDALEVAVTLEKVRHLFCTEISLHVSHDFIIRAHGSDANPYRSPDLAIEILEGRLKRYRNRFRDRRRREQEQEEILSAQQYMPGASAENHDGDEVPLVIADMNHQVLKLSVGEAAMRMDMSDHPFLMFHNAKDDKVNLVYRREDGHIGWIDPTTGAKKP